MDSYRFTTRSQQALSDAVTTAAADGHPHVEPLHLLVALLEPTDGVPRPLIEAAGGDPAKVLTEAKGENVLKKLKKEGAPSSIKWTAPPDSKGNQALKILADQD